MINFIAANWLWIAFIVAMLSMHRGGGCGGHGRQHGKHAQHERDSDQTGRDSDERIRT